MKFRLLIGRKSHQSSYEEERGAHSGPREIRPAFAEIDVNYDYIMAREEVCA